MGRSHLNKDNKMPEKDYDNKDKAFARNAITPSEDDLADSDNVSPPPSPPGSPPKPTDDEAAPHASTSTPLFKPQDDIDFPSPITSTSKPKTAARTSLLTEAIKKSNDSDYEHVDPSKDTELGEEGVVVESEDADDEFEMVEPGKKLPNGRDLEGNGKHFAGQKAWDDAMKEDKEREGGDGEGEQGVGTFWVKEGESKKAGK